MDVHKGWFNISEDSWEVYLNSKLKRLMELVRYAMQVGGGGGGSVGSGREEGRWLKSASERRRMRGEGRGVMAPVKCIYKCTIVSACLCH